MEAATDLIPKAAQPFLEQGILGAMVVVLAIALVGAVVVMRRDTNAERARYDAEIAAKDKQIFELQTAWREDTKTSLMSVTTALDTVRVVHAALQERR
jgi:hypothetical protein